MLRLLSMLTCTLYFKNYYKRGLIGYNDLLRLEVTRLEVIYDIGDSLNKAILYKNRKRLYCADYGFNS